MAGSPNFLAIRLPVLIVIAISQGFRAISPQNRRDGGFRRDAGGTSVRYRFTRTIYRFDADENRLGSLFTPSHNCPLHLRINRCITVAPRPINVCIPLARRTMHSRDVRWVQIVSEIRIFSTNKIDIIKFDIT